MNRLRSASRALATVACATMPCACAIFHVGIPKQNGPYPTGRSTFLLVDSTRRDPWVRTDTVRNVLVKAWYPTTPGSTAPLAQYFPDVDKLAGDFQFGERFVAKRMKSEARLNAGVTPSRWPLIVFSPGADMPPEYYASLLQDLASRGFVVFAIDHAHEGRGQLLPGGRLLGAEAEHQPMPPPAAMFARYDQRVAIRAADASFLLDALTSGQLPVRFRERLDLARVGALGHSLGGVTAAELCRRDRRVVACANLDGLVRSRPTSDGPTSTLQRVLMYVGKPLRTLPPSDSTKARASLRAAIAVAGGGYDVTIDDANHDSFSDAPYLKPSLRGKGSVTRWVRELVSGFFSGALLSQPSALLDTSAGLPKSIRVTRIGRDSVAHR